MSSKVKIRTRRLMLMSFSYLAIDIAVSNNIAKTAKCAITF